MHKSQGNVSGETIRVEIQSAIQSLKLAQGAFYDISWYRSVAGYGERTLPFAPLLPLLPLLLGQGHLGPYF
ncbi:MAG: hypothetical protein AAGC54_17720, partial [Cyanobacteria bacterium P01_F01_bin.4]